jgi:hypothetical protein
VALDDKFYYVNNVYDPYVNSFIDSRIQNAKTCFFTPISPKNSNSGKKKPEIIYRHYRSDDCSSLIWYNNFIGG